jgi:hypothetical protein
MPSWLRGVLAIAAGFIAWFAAATVGNWAIRALVPGYVEVEKSMDSAIPPGRSSSRRSPSCNSAAPSPGGHLLALSQPVELSGTLGFLCQGSSRCLTTAWNGGASRR